MIDVYLHVCWAGPRDPEPEPRTVGLRYPTGPSGLTDPMGSAICAVSSITRRAPSVAVCRTLNSRISH
jgi:hypothetical protein